MSNFEYLKKQRDLVAKKQQFSPGRVCSNYVQVNYAVTTFEILLSLREYVHCVTQLKA